MSKEKNKILDSDTNTASNKLKRFPKKITNNSNKYELFNVLSETEDSIYTPTINSNSHIKVKQGEQVYISLSEIRKIVNEELDERLGSSNKYE